MPKGKNTNLGGLEFDVQLDLDQLKKGQDAIFVQLKNMEKGTDKAEKALDKLEKTGTKAGVGMKKVAGGMIVAQGAMKAFNLALQGAKEFFEFDKNMRNVNTMMRLSADNFQVAKLQLLDISKRVPQTANELAQGLYSVVSAGVPAGESMQFLETSAVAATAGLSDTATSVLGLTAVIKGYNLEFTDASYVSDLFFKTVELGQTTFGEMANSIQEVTSVAKIGNVSLEELFASYATLTGVTGNTAKVSTQLKGAIQALAAPTREASAKFKQLGVEVGQDAIQKKGFVEVAKEVYDAVGGNAEALRQLIPEVEGATAVIALASTQNDVYTEKLGKMQEASGATKSAFDEQSKSAYFQAQILKNKLNAALYTLGEGLLPLINEALGAGSGAMDKMSASAEGTTKQLGILELAILVIVGAVSLLSTGIDTLWTAIKTTGALVTNFFVETTWGIVSLAEKGFQIAAKLMSFFKGREVNPNEITPAFITDLKAQLEQTNKDLDDYTEDQVDDFMERTKARMDNFTRFKENLMKTGMEGILKSNLQTKNDIENAFAAAAGGGLGGGGASDAKAEKEKALKDLEKQVEEAEKRVEDVREKYAKKREEAYKKYQKDIDDTTKELAKLEEAHSEMRKSVEEDLRALQNELGELQKGYDQTIADLDKGFSEDVASGVVELRGELAELQKELKEVQGNADQTDRANELRQKIKEIQAEIQSGLELVSPEAVAEATRRAGLTEFQRMAEDLQMQKDLETEKFEEDKARLEEKQAIFQAYLDGTLESITAANDFENQLLLEKLVAEQENYDTRKETLNAFLEDSVTKQAIALARIESQNSRVTQALIQQWNAVKAARDAANGHATGGIVEQFATGGMVRGAGGPTDDKIRALLSSGEFVMNARSTSLMRPLLETLNRIKSPAQLSSLPAFANGGLVGGGTTNNNTNTTNINVDGRGVAGDPNALARAIAWNQKYS